MFKRILFVLLVLGLAVFSFGQTSPWGPPARQVYTDPSGWQYIPATNTTSQRVYNWLDQLFWTTQIVTHAVFPSLLQQYGNLYFVSYYGSTNWLQTTLFNLYPYLDLDYRDGLSHGLLQTNSTYMWTLTVDHSNAVFVLGIPSVLTTYNSLYAFVSNLAYQIAYSLVSAVSTSAPGPPPPTNSGPWFTEGEVFRGQSGLITLGKRPANMSNPQSAEPTFNRHAGWLTDPTYSSFTVSTAGTYTIRFVGAVNHAQSDQLGDGHPDLWTLEILVDNIVVASASYEFNHGKPIISGLEASYTLVIPSPGARTIKFRATVQNVPSATSDYVSAVYSAFITFAPP